MNFGDEAALDSIGSEIQKQDRQLTDLDLEMNACIKEQAYNQEETRDQLTKINSEAIVLIDKIGSVKKNATESQDIVEGGCLEIR